MPAEWKTKENVERARYKLRLPFTSRIPWPLEKILHFNF